VCTQRHTRSLASPGGGCHGHDGSALHIALPQLDMVCHARISAAMWCWVCVSRAGQGPGMT
jgi:hypothetical protein